MRYVFALCFLASLWPASAAQAGQPYKESLMECAVLIELLIGQETQGPNALEMLQVYDGTARAMRVEAARRGGPVYVRDMAVIKRRDWRQRWDAGNWDQPENRGALEDWLTYCFKFADHLGLEPVPAGGL